MKKIVKRVEIYLAKDGKEFLNMTDCIFYEEYVLPINQRKEWVERYFSDLCKNRQKWLRDCNENDKFFGSILDHNRDTHILNDMLLRQRDGRTIIINIRTGRCGKAIQTNPKFFDSQVGWAVAWARYRGDEVPDYI